MKMRKRLSARGLSFHASASTGHARCWDTPNSAAPAVLQGYGLPDIHADRCILDRPSDVAEIADRLGAPDHVVLQALVELDEVRAETGDADHQVPVGLGVELCISKRS